MVGCTGGGHGDHLTLRTRWRGRLKNTSHSSPTSTVETLFWQLAAAGLTDSWDKLLPDKLPYLWAQSLSDIPYEDPGESVRMIPTMELAHMHVKTTINSYQSQAGVQSKLLQLELLPAALQSPFPSRVLAQL